MLNALRLNGGFTASLFEARTGLALGAVAPQLSAAVTRGLLAPLPAAAGPGWAPTALGLRFLNDLQGLFLG